MSAALPGPQSFLLDGAVLEIPWTGIAKVTLGLYRSCLELNPHLQIVVLHRRPLRGQLPPGMRAVQGGTRLPNRVWRAVGLPLYAQRHPADVMHFPWNFGIPKFLTKNIMTALTLHDVLPLTLPNYFPDEKAKTAFRRRVQQDLKHADLVLTDSHFSRDSIMQAFQVARPPRVIYPAAQMVANQTALTGSTPAAPYFFYCGGYDPRKGLERLTQTIVALWRDEQFKIPLHIAGEINHSYVSPRLGQIMQEGEALGAIQELGYVTDECLASLYRGALALIYPSRYEGFGMPPLEAMSLGCPVITYPLTSLPEVCGAAALYLDPDHDNSLREAILKLATQNELRKTLAAQGLLQAAKFSWREAATRFMDALTEIQSQRWRPTLP